LLHEVNMTATGINTWSVQGNNIKGLVSRQEMDLHIQAENAAGLVIVENSFSRDVFLNVVLPDFVLPMGQVAGETGGHAKNEGHCIKDTFHILNT